MRFFVSGRGSGKTTRLISEALVCAIEHPTAIVTHDKLERDRLRLQYKKDLAGSKLEILSLDELQLMSGVRKYRRVFVDNMDLIMMRMFRRFTDLENNGRIELTAMTGEPVRDMAIIKMAASDLWKSAAQLALAAAQDEGIPDSEKIPRLVLEFTRRARILLNQSEKENKENG